MSLLDKVDTIRGPSEQREPGKTSKRNERHPARANRFWLISFNTQQFGRLMDLCQHCSSTLNRAYATGYSN